MKRISALGVLTLFLMMPAYGMDDSQDDSQKEITSIAKIQAGIAAAAPLLVCPPLMIPIAALMSITIPRISMTVPHVPDLAVRAGITAACTMPMNVAIAAAGDRYLAPQSSMLNVISKSLAGMYLSNQTSDFLTRNHIIPPAPDTSTLAEFAGHTAVSFAVSTATQRIMHIPYDQCMKNLSQNYRQKNDIIAKITKQFAIHKPVPIQIHTWEPSKSSKIEMRKKSEEMNAQWPQPQSNISCQLYLKDGALIVNEAVSVQGSPFILTSVTTYTTENTEWHYLHPFGLDKFREEITSLHKTVLQNHMTTANIPLSTIMNTPDASQAIQ
jgi:hypothetical protein